MTTRTTLFAAIRTTEGRDWIDLATIAPTSDDARRFAAESTENLPSWAKENPVTRIAIIKIEELYQ